MFARVSFLLALSGCAFVSEEHKEWRLNPDNDDVLWPDDCNDKDESIGIINWYIDSDGDGYGDDTTKVTVCEPPQQDMVQVGGDCDDTDAAINPATIEVCDGIDNNCDNKKDDDDELVDLADAQTFYLDIDGDGYGDGTSFVRACTQPDGYVSNATDCDDNNEIIYPDNPESCDDFDNDCDGEVDEGVLNAYYLDSDGDGYGDQNQLVLACLQPETYTTNGDDCNDADSTINPLAEEVCDGVDNDCDALIDGQDNVLDPDNVEVYYLDEDGDSYGNPLVTIEACALPNGYTTDNRDCDDGSAQTYPGAASEESPTLCMKDADFDGYGDASPPSGVTEGTDCDDTALSIRPFASEIPADGVDQNCDANEICYLDADIDGYGVSATILSTSISCTAPGVSDNSSDCDGSSGKTYPGAAEFESATDCMLDLDEDGYGSDTVPTGVISGTDCDDMNQTVHPAAAESPADNVDQNCDGNEECYDDVDGDGHGTPNGISSVTDISCAQTLGVSPYADDCDDTDEFTYPGAAYKETLSTLCMSDADMDGYGDQNPGSIVAAGTDCDDSNGTVFPWAAETKGDGIDENCDNLESNGLNGIGIDQCEGGPTGVNGKYLLLCNVFLDYDTAQSLCFNNGYSGLAAVNDSNEHNYLEGLVPFALTNNDRYWIGLYSPVSSSNFFWEDGSVFDPSVYSNWDSSQQQSFDPTVKNCVTSGTTGWVMTDCLESLPFACSYR